MAATMDGNEIVLVTCLDVEVNRIEGQVKYADGSIERFLDAEGVLDMAAGDQLRLDAPPAGFDAATWDGSIKAEATRILVTLMSDKDVDIVGQFELPISSDGTWMGPNGESTEACPEESSKSD